MTTKFGEEEEVELELCLSLGGGSKKTAKSKPRESETTKRERKNSQRSGGCKRIKRECKSISSSHEMYGSDQFINNCESATTFDSSSDASDPIKPVENSSKTKPVENSSQTKPVNNIETGTEEIVHNTDGSNGTVVVDAPKPPKPSLNGNGKLLPFDQMPCVTSTGNGPEGKTVNGFLYRYSKSEISIICVCHGTSFSPAEFIIHAGGTHVSHPLRHITVVPSTL